MATVAWAWQQQQAGNLEEAERACRQIVVTEPADAGAWFLLGTVYQTQARLPEAEDAFRRAVALRPREAQGHFHLGNALLQQGKLVEAEDAFRACVRLRPDHLQGLTNWGVALGRRRHLAKALACFDAALRVCPDVAEIHHNRGNMLRDFGRLDDALAAYRQALRLKPDYAKAHVNLGAALITLGRLDEAETSLRRGLELHPDSPEAHSSLGGLLSLQGKTGAAIEHYQRAVALRPDFAEAHWNLALAWLLEGRFELGWPEYEWRWRRPNHAPLPDHGRPFWDGTPLDGQAILLHAEQGLGDTLQFIRYAALVKERGGTVIVQCQKSLVPLLRLCAGLDLAVAPGEALPPFAVHAPLLSLPRIFATTLATIPARVPYLRTKEDLTLHWQRRLAPLRRLRVGIVWQGSRTHAWDRHRSIALAHFEPLARIEGVQLISLQRGDGAEQLAAVADRFAVVSFDGELDEAAGPFMDTAAILANLDLLISVDTAVAHLAGALGVPVWVPLSVGPDWRWMLDRDDSPWYPSMRLFRQRQLGEWSEVFGRMAEQARLGLPR
jgi:tetratricopeptide (TPR) repeat protein